MSGDQYGGQMMDKMPVLFMGHGSPMNAIEENVFADGWREIAQAIPRPKAILCVSAHWETRGVWVTAMEQPRTIHDFGGFPRQLYEVEYPAPGNPGLAGQVAEIIQSTSVGLDQSWGLDHGSWSVIRRMYPEADIPVVQLSLEHYQPPAFHYTLGKELAGLRRQGVLILGSGNMVHNLRRVVMRTGSLNDFNEPFGLDWAIEAHALFKKLILEGNHAALIDYNSLGEAARLAVPTPEHYLPLLYALALREADEALSFFNDVLVGGSLAMTCVRID